MEASAGLADWLLHEFSKRGDKCWFESLLFTYIQTTWRQVLVWIIAVYMCSASMEISVGLNLCCLHVQTAWRQVLVYTIVVYMSSASVEISVALNFCCLRMFRQHGDKCWSDSLLFTCVQPTQR